MRKIIDGNKGVSPILAIIILIGITLVVAGVAAVWFLGFASNRDDGSDGADIYVFNVKLDGSSDKITFTIISGEFLNTTKMVLRIDGTTIPIPIMKIGAGTDVEVDSGMDLQVGSYYKVKITVSNSLFYDNELVARP